MSVDVSNVSLLHEAPLEVLRDAPETLLELMRHARVGGELSADLKVTVIDSALTEAVPSARHADLVLQLHDGVGRVAHVVVVVESQRDRDPEKLAANRAFGRPLVQWRTKPPRPIPCLDIFSSPARFAPCL